MKKARTQEQQAAGEEREIREREKRREGALRESGVQ